MCVILKRPRAADDLIELWDYIAEDQVRAGVAAPDCRIGGKEIDMMMTTKAKPVRAAKRDLFAEVSEGMVALAEHREGKRTLRTHGVDCKPAPKVTPRRSD